MYTLHGNVLLDHQLIPGTIRVANGQIREVLPAVEHRPAKSASTEAHIIAPGFIDLQVNGGYGYDVVHDANAIEVLARRLPATGVTGFLPTLITSTRDEYLRAMRRVVSSPELPGAHVLGLHLEGPFLSVERPGAHRRDLIEAADPSLLDELLAMDTASIIRLMTLAPERPGASEMIQRLRSHGSLVSLGHTNATYEGFRAAVDEGARMATHLFNAMSPFDHRSPNVIGAALLDDRITVGLIADGVHTHPASLELAVRARGPERIALVTDMMAAAGMPDGRYRLGDRDVESSKGTVRLPNGTLAGSVLLMDQAVRNMVRWTSATVPQALRMAGEIPARVLGLPRTGRIEPGFTADLVLLDADLRVQATMVGGAWAYERGKA